MKATWPVIAVAVITAWVMGCSSPLLLPKPDVIIHGTVPRVLDGDTLMLATDSGQQAKVRLAQIDAPEKSQPFGPEAKACLESMVTGRVVGVLCKNTDLYGRTVGEVFCDGKSVNEQMVAKGMAWQYMAYDHSVELMNLEISARTNRLGLWVQPNPEPPWQYRKKGKVSEL